MHTEDSEPVRIPITDVFDLHTIPPGMFARLWKNTSSKHTGWVTGRCGSSTDAALACSARSSATYFPRRPLCRVPRRAGGSRRLGRDHRDAALSNRDGLRINSRKMFVSQQFQAIIGNSEGSYAWVVGNTNIAVAGVAVSPCWGQAPTITTIQASYVGGQPTNVGGITSGMSLQGGVYPLYQRHIQSERIHQRQWYNPSTNFTTVFTAAAATVTPTQVILQIPNTLFQAPVSSPVTVQITVLEQGGGVGQHISDQPSAGSGSADAPARHPDGTVQREPDQRRKRSIPGGDHHRASSRFESQRHCACGNAIADRCFQLPNLRLGFLAGQ